MKTKYELWDTETSNLVGIYSTEDAALAVVRDAISRHGEEAIATVALGCENDSGRLIAVAKGEALVALANRGNPNSARMLSRGDSGMDPDHLKESDPAARRKTA